MIDPFQNLTAIKFSQYVRGLYNELKGKTELSTDEQYIWENYLNFTISADVFAYGAINPNKEYEFEFTTRFDLSQEDRERLYNKHEDPETLATCQIKNTDSTSAVYVLNLGYIFVEKDEDGDALYEDTL